MVPAGIGGVHHGPGREDAGHALVGDAGRAHVGGEVAGQVGVAMRWTQPGAGIGSTTGRFEVDAGSASART
jgi:hypothetical protein